MVPGNSSISIKSSRNCSLEQIKMDYEKYCFLVPYTVTLELWSLLSSKVLFICTTELQLKIM